MKSPLHCVHGETERTHTQHRKKISLSIIYDILSPKTSGALVRFDIVC